MKNTVKQIKANPSIVESVESVESTVVDTTETTPAWFETIPADILNEATKLIESGKTLSVIKGFLAFKGLKPKEITKVILGLIPAKEIKPRGDSIRSVLWAVCAERVMDDKEFAGLFEQDWCTENMKKSRAIFDAERKMFNKIHGKYGK